MTTSEKIDLLTKDFLERDEHNHFVRIRRTDRLGWESTIPENGAYSEFITHPKSKEDLIRNAYGMATDIVKVMDTPFKVNITISPDTSCTDSKTVWVATKAFDDPDLSNGQKLDTFIGLAVHESCHLLYTDFAASEKDSVTRTIQNILEDERIERLCGDAKPGLANFLAAAKYYHFGKYKAELEKNGGLQGPSPFKRLLNCILSFVRYPKALEMNDLEEFADTMLAVREILTPFPSTTAEAGEAARRIRDLLKDEAEKQRNGQKKGGGSGQDGKTKEKGDDAQESADRTVSKEMSEMSGALSNIMQDPEKTTLQEHEMSDTVKEDGGKVGKVCMGKCERGLLKGSYIEKGTDDKDKYNEALERVRRYVPAIGRALKCSSTEYRFSLHGMRSGRLDTGKLAEAFQGVPTVYEREGEVKAQKISVCILVDESGSMWGPGEQAARDTAILLNEALGKVPNVDLYIYGHTASRSTTNLFVYRERGFSKRYALGSTDSRAGNHDSVAIREAAARVRRYTKERCLFFIVSDGAPNESTDLVRQAVKDVEKDGFDLVAISIDPYYDPSTMYDHNVNLSDMGALAPELGKMVKRAILKNTRKRVNI